MQPANTDDCTQKCSRISGGTGTLRKTASDTSSAVCSRAASVCSTGFGEGRGRVISIQFNNLFRQSSGAAGFRSGNRAYRAISVSDNRACPAIIEPDSQRVPAVGQPTAAPGCPAKIEIYRRIGTVRTLRAGVHFEHWRKIAIFRPPSTSLSMEKGYRIILTVSLLLTIFTTTAQTADTSKDNFPSTQEALSRIGAAEARPQGRSAT